jgi:hypothetical protein
MIRGLAFVIALAFPVSSLAQSITIETTPLSEEEDLPRPTQPAERGERGTGAVLRALDKVSGETVDIDLPSGRAARIFGLEVGLSDCRYPAGNPAGDAFAFLMIRNQGETEPMFSGWMMASSPALNALDHARYDVWVLRCKTS